MRCMIVTGVLRPGAPRIGSIGNNIQLPRSVPLPSLLAGIAGALVMLPFAVLLNAVTGAGGGAALVFVVLLSGGGALAGVWLVTWQPWAGESVRRAVWVAAGTYARRRSHMCPGSAQPLIVDEMTGERYCVACETAPPDVDGCAGWHDVRRELYIGLQRIEPSVLGPVRFTPGNVPAGQRTGWGDRVLQRPQVHRLREMLSRLSPKRRPQHERHDELLAANEVEPGTCRCGCGEPEIEATRYYAKHLSICRHLADRMERLTEANPTVRPECEDLLWSWRRASRPLDALVHQEPIPANALGAPTTTWLMVWREMVLEVLDGR